MGARKIPRDVDISILGIDRDFPTLDKGMAAVVFPMVRPAVN